ncbi:MAG: hypothetical protein RLZZ450_4556 [Pseudomonadota bacterium]|jgi:hypothetical protein
MLVACSSAGDPAPSKPGEPIDKGPPGTKLTVTRPAADDAAFSALKSKVKAAEKLDAAGARAAYPTHFVEKLSYDPNTAGFLDRIQASALALSPSESQLLGSRGFAISQKRTFSTFLRGLAEIYAEHLPLYVTADALLESVHRSYDEILVRVEKQMVIPELRALLEGMQSRLPSADASVETRADADLYLAVALSLLNGKPAQPVAGADEAAIADLVDKATKAKGTAEVTLFGVQREEDFSQFTPRGHYNREDTLKQYFRAQMWLGRVDFRILETQPDGSQVFRRQQYLSTLLFDRLVGEDRPRFERIDGAIRTFVGESDSMVLPEVAKLVTDLGGEQAAATASDSAVVTALLAGGYGKQQIASHLMVNDGTVDTLPLSRSFALLGQRYVVDSHVFSEVVYDRLKQKRMMPSPLDAAFAALGNAQALALDRDVDKFSELPGALSRMRVLVDAHDDTFWNANFYNLWLRSLRALSPAADLTTVEGLPEVATTEAWGRRLLNTQLGSWAELRHDTLLYAKQSYTGIPECEFPDAYVDPYPAFYQALVHYAESGSRLADLMTEVDPTTAQSIVDYFALLAQTGKTLGDMAERELRGEPFSTEQLAFINEAVRVEKKSAGCTTVEVPDGWYASLFFDRNKSIEFDPTIADVHTQPADEAGAIVGKVLHVATGYPRMMVTTVDTCVGPRAYVGVVYGYQEVVTQDFERLTDGEWATRVRAKPAVSEVPWLDDVVAK